MYFVPFTWTIYVSRKTKLSRNSVLHALCLLVNAIILLTSSTSHDLSITYFILVCTLILLYNKILNFSRYYILIPHILGNHPDVKGIFFCFVPLFILFVNRIDPKYLKFSSLWNANVSFCTSIEICNCIAYTLQVWFPGSITGIPIKNAR